jgi:hypothetical protein
VANCTLTYECFFKGILVEQLTPVCLDNSLNDNRMIPRQTEGKWNDSNSHTRGGGVKCASPFKMTEIEVAQWYRKLFKYFNIFHNEHWRRY